MLHDPWSVPSAMLLSHHPSITEGTGWTGDLVATWPRPVTLAAAPIQNNSGPPHGPAGYPAAG